VFYSARRLASLLRADASAFEERVGLQQARVRAGVQDTWIWGDAAPTWPA